MKIARVLHVRSKTPILALERDGALYDVEQLERSFGTRYRELDRASDYRVRIVSLKSDGLFTLDERLASGDRPTSARLTAGSFIRLAPIDDESDFAYVRSARDETNGLDYWIGNHRAIFASDKEIQFPSEADERRLDLGLAAVLNEDLSVATARQAASAIAGLTVACDWICPTEPNSSTRKLIVRDFGSQLGPVLCIDELAADFSPRFLLKSNGEAFERGVLTAPFSALVDAIVQVTKRMRLCAGDLVAVSGFETGLPSRGQIEVAVERLGTVRMRPAAQRAER